MKQPIFSMRDEASGTYLAPQLDTSERSAVRSFQFALEKNEMMNFRKSDFSLWYVGEFDSELGTIDPVIPNLIMRGED